MKTFALRVIALFFLCGISFAQSTVNVSGHIITGSGTVSSANISILWELINDNGQICKVAASGIIVPPSFSVTRAQLAAGIPLIPNSTISCGTTLGASRWRFTVKSGGVGTRQCSLNITGDTNLDSVSCLNSLPTTPIPATGDALYCRIDGTNCGFTGAISGTSFVFSGNGALATLGVTGLSTLAAVTASGLATLNGGGALTGTFTGNPTLSGNPIFSGNPKFSGAPIFTGPHPYYDPRVAGALCDGATDDTSAFNTTINAANAGGGGWVLVPAGKTCVIAGQLNLAQMKGVRLASVTGIATFNTPLPILKFTGSTSPLVDARSSQGLEFDHFTLQYTNASFAGRVIDFQHVIASDSQNFRVHDMTITGTSAAKGAICLVCADNTDVGIVDKVSFFWALHAVEALNGNIFTVTNSNFASGNSGVGDITGDYITDLGNASFIGPGNNFEMSTNTSAIHCLTCGNDITIFDNTFNDFVAGYNSVMININSNSINVQDNFVGTGPGGTATFFSAAGAVGTFNLTGNTLGNWGTAWIGLNGPAKSANITNNSYGTISTFMNICCPTSGTIQDNSGITTTYGVSQTNFNTKRLIGSDFTTANNTNLQTITGLSWTFPAVAANYSFHCSLLFSQATAAVADQFGIQVATNAPTNVAAVGEVFPSATTQTVGTLATLSTTTATPIVTFTPSAITTVFGGSIDGTFELPASANTVNIMVQTSAGADAVTVKRGSYCQLI